MAENSKIGWCDHTFNPWYGCTKVSDGCVNCYAEDQMDKRWGRVKWGRGNPRQRSSKSIWSQPRLWNKRAAENCKRSLVFCASLADVMDEEIPPEWRRDLFRVIRDTPNLRWLLLTKRPENYRQFLPTRADGWPWPNVWLGTTVESAKYEYRLSYLCALPAVVHFASYEPALGPVDFSPWLEKAGEGFALSWVIAGGESGRLARPADADWYRRVRDDCRAHGAAFFMKQMGSVEARRLSLPLMSKGEAESAVPPDLLVREWPREWRLAEIAGGRGVPGR